MRLDRVDRTEAASERCVEPSVRDVHARRRPAERLRPFARASRDSGRRRFRCTAFPARARGRRARSRAGPGRTPPADARRSSGTRPTPRTASAASVETPAPGTSSASARPRATARPMRVLVKLPGPGADDERVEVRGDPRLHPRAARRRPRAACAATRRRSPRTRSVVDERARRDVGRGVEGENEHHAMPCSSAALVGRRA